MLAEISDVRRIGRLPDPEKLPDADIAVHLESASRELTTWVGSYETDGDAEKQKACSEAECCIAMAYLLPTLNTLFPRTLYSIEKQVGETEFSYHSPGQIRELREFWMSRARSRMMPYLSNAAVRTRIGYAVI
jgi:hypothetical protein